MAYKSTPAKGSISSLISDGYGEIAELGEECRSASDNFPNSEHPKAQAFAEAADTLEGVSEADVPDCLSENDAEVSYSLLVNKDKRKGTARHARCSNACGKLTAAADGIRALIEELSAEKGALESRLEDVNKGTLEEGDDALTADEMQERIDLLETRDSDLEELADQLESDAGDCEGVEFPGLYG